jgi:hypothetical protein
MSIFSALEDRISDAKAIQSILHDELYPRLEDMRKKGHLSEVIAVIDDIDNRIEDLIHDLSADAQDMRDEGGRL